MIKIEVADTFISRFLGLMGRKNLPQGHGLLISPCSSIHMLFMRFSIDAVYINKDFEIQKIVPHLKPWIGFSICINAWSVIEISAGEAERLNLKVGQKIKVDAGE